MRLGHDRAAALVAVVGVGAVARAICGGIAPSASGLVAVVRILLLMPDLLLLQWVSLRQSARQHSTYFSKSFPMSLGISWSGPPRVSNDFRDFWIRKAGILGNNTRLMMLTEENESCFCYLLRNHYGYASPLEGITSRSFLPFLGRGTFGSGWQRQTWLGDSRLLEALPSVGTVSNSFFDSRRRSSMGLAEAARLRPRRVDERREWLGVVGEVSSCSFVSGLAVSWSAGNEML